MVDDDFTKFLRFRWEDLIRRARLDRVVPAQGKRGAVSGAQFKAVAFAWSSYANPDGTKAYPSIAMVSVAAEVSYKTADLVTKKMIEFGLLELAVASRRRRGHYNEYRLAIPENLLDLVEVLDPEVMKKAAEEVRQRYRGKARVGGPVDPQASEPEGGPPDPQETGSDGGPEVPQAGWPDESVGGPVDWGR